jgi:hypothetical protein
VEGQSADKKDVPDSLVQRSGCITTAQAVFALQNH